MADLFNSDIGDTIKLCPEDWTTRATALVSNVCGELLNPLAIAYVLLQVLIMESILVLRVWAMSGRRRNILYILSLFLLLSMGASAFIYGYEDNFSDVRYWVPLLVFECLLFLTAAVYGLRGVKITRILTQACHNFGPKPIMRLLLRDSVFYFVIVLCCYPVLVLLDNTMGLTLMSISITRMLLRLRKRAEADVNILRTQDIELATVQFANPATEAPMASASDTYT
ncbi:hypothetical protein EDD85DRAFT_1025713 [Armillaria nabsnona]|nr:hypothetical protein EDD85DRAFT_1025713 [Armillaria nabsnona]